MDLRVISRGSIFFFLLGLLGVIPLSPAVAAECVKSSTFQNGYVYLAFRDTSATCTWTIPADATVIDYLLVGGGGSGGSRHAGGGGAGGLVKGSNVSLSGITSLNIKVGNGGTAVIPSALNYAVGVNGETSTIVKNVGSGSFSSISAAGGGGGESGGVGAKSGGSGGGSQTSTTSTPVSGQGNRGGTGGVGSSEWWSGGGGGAGGVGGNGASNAGGVGGAGAIWNSDFTTTIATALGLAQTNQTSGNQVYFAGGGGGSITSSNPGSGGLGGGGAAVLGNGTATSGTANSGGGGGGSGCCNGGWSGAGGSGVAILRYPANSGLTLSINTTPIFRASTNIVATANIDGRVTFFANGKVIPGCKNRSTSSKTVTCVWRPSVHGRNSISATITSSTFASYTGSFASSTQTSKRSGSR
jgi:hypothetical protein